MHIQTEAQMLPSIKRMQKVCNSAERIFKLIRL